jgi:hypothetical protein
LPDAVAVDGDGVVGYDCGHEVTTMAELKQVGVREFRDHATAYLSGSDPVAVTKHDRIIGVYVPLERDEEEVRHAIERFGESINKLLKDTGMTEDELIELLGLDK